MNFATINNSNNNFAIILASGTGQRFNSQVPKQFINLSGKPILFHTIKKFYDSNNFEKILVTLPVGYKNQPLVDSLNADFENLVFLEGSSSRNLSTYSALELLREEEESSNVLIHDAVRPLVEISHLRRIIDKLSSCEAVDSFTESTDTLFSSGDGTKIDQFLDRSAVKRGLTPQGFKLNAIFKAYQHAYNLGKMNFSDDCQIYHFFKPSSPIYLVKSSSKNIKITHPEDLIFAEKLITELDTPTDKHSVLLSDYSKSVAIVHGGSGAIGQIVSELLSSVFHKVVKLDSSLNCLDIRHLSDFYDENSNLDVSLVVNCVGAMYLDNSIESDINNFYGLVEKNLLCSYNIFQVSKSILLKNKGRFIQINSAVDSSYREDQLMYGTVKNSIEYLLKGLAWKYQGKLLINLISPSRVRSPMRLSAFPNEKDSDHDFVNPEQIKSALLDILLSDISGSNFKIRAGIFEKD